jgi:hypothetical protein
LSVEPDALGGVATHNDVAREKPNDWLVLPIKQDGGIMREIGAVWQKPSVKPTHYAAALAAATAASWNAIISSSHQTTACPSGSSFTPVGNFFSEIFK